jgi:hypothetical protein
VKALLALADAGVEFVLVGGMASVAQGVPYVTHDTDIVPNLAPENLDRLYGVLLSLHARVRGRPGPPLTPARHNLGPGHLLLDTDAGWLDVLGTLVGGRSYADLQPHTIELVIEGRRLAVLDLETILEIKRELDTPKDRAQNQLIEATLARRSGKQDS